MVIVVLVAGLVAGFGGWFGGWFWWVVLVGGFGYGDDGDGGLKTIKKFS